MYLLETNKIKKLLLGETCKTCDFRDVSTFNTCPIIEKAGINRNKINTCNFWYHNNDFRMVLEWMKQEFKKSKTMKETIKCLIKGSK